MEATTRNCTSKFHTFNNKQRRLWNFFHRQCCAILSITMVMISWVWHSIHERSFVTEHERFSPFPRIQTKAKLYKRKPVFIEIPCDCKCHLPNLMEEMVGCDAMQQQCSAWRHRSCAGADADDDWLCTPHRNKWKGGKWQKKKTKDKNKNRRTLADKSHVHVVGSRNIHINYMYG